MRKVLIFAVLALASSAVVVALGFMSASVSGCASSGTGTFECAASVFGGTGSYNYWWTYSGPGHLYQTNSAIVTITDCLDGEGSLSVQVRDVETDQIARSDPFKIFCDCSPVNREACAVDIYPEDGLPY